MAIYMKFDGIEGNVTAKGHEKWIELESIQFGVGRSITFKTGNSSDREATAPQVGEVTVSKSMDPASPKLFAEGCYGKSKKVEIHLCKTDQGQLQTYMEYVLENVLVSGYSLSSTGERPNETLSLNFTKVEMKFVPWKDDHTKAAPITAGYDTALGQKV